MLLDYSVQKTFEQTVDIVDAGNTALRCENNEGDEFYIITKTVRGKTSILFFGPVTPDMNCSFNPGFDMNFMQLNYDEKKIEKSFSSYVNDPRKKIINIEECTEYEALQEVPDVAAALNNIGV